MSKNRAPCTAWGCQSVARSYRQQFYQLPQLVGQQSGFLLTSHSTATCGKDLDKSCDAASLYNENFAFSALMM